MLLDDMSDSDDEFQSDEEDMMNDRASEELMPKDAHISTQSVERPYSLNESVHEED